MISCRKRNASLLLQTYGYGRAALQPHADPPQPQPVYYWRRYVGCKATCTPESPAFCALRRTSRVQIAMSLHLREPGKTRPVVFTFSAAERARQLGLARGGGALNVVTKVPYKTLSIALKPGPSKDAAELSLLFLQPLDFEIARSSFLMKPSRQIDSWFVRHRYTKSPCILRVQAHLLLSFRLQPPRCGC